MYAYDDTGLRITKTVNGVEHKYYYDGNLLIYEEYGDDMLIYVYDENGSPIGVKHRNKNFAAEQLETYLYGKNLQGDIIAIYNTSGTAVVKYVYDAWGNIISTSGTQATGIGAKNSLRYRGYYYDTETGLYYLQARYYDPVTGRFINADSLIGANRGMDGNNLYAYCGNNPVMYCDPSGLVCICMNQRIHGKHVCNYQGDMKDVQLLLEFSEKYYNSTGNNYDWGGNGFSTISIQKSITAVSTFEAIASNTIITGTSMLLSTVLPMVGATVVCANIMGSIFGIAAGSSGSPKLSAGNYETYTVKKIKYVSGRVEIANYRGHIIYEDRQFEVIDEYRYIFSNGDLAETKWSRIDKSISDKWWKYHP